MVITAADE